MIVYTWAYDRQFVLLLAGRYMSLYSVEMKISIWELWSVIHFHFHFLAWDFVSVFKENK